MTYEHIFKVFKSLYIIILNALSFHCHLYVIVIIIIIITIICPQHKAAGVKNK